MEVNSFFFCFYQWYVSINMENKYINNNCYNKKKKEKILSWSFNEWKLDEKKNDDLPSTQTILIHTGENCIPKNSEILGLDQVIENWPIQSFKRNRNDLLECGRNNRLVFTSNPYPYLVLCLSYGKDKQTHWNQYKTKTKKKKNEKGKWDQTNILMKCVTRCFH